MCLDNSPCPRYIHANIFTIICVMVTRVMNAAPLMDNDVNV